MSIRPGSSGLTRRYHARRSCITRSPPGWFARRVPRVRAGIGCGGTKPLYGVGQPSRDPTSAICGRVFGVRQTDRPPYLQWVVSVCPLCSSCRGSFDPKGVSMIRFSCPQCDKGLRTTDDAMAGTIVNCPACGHMVTIPEPEAEPSQSDHEEPKRPPLARRSGLALDPSQRGKLMARYWF